QLFHERIKLVFEDPSLPVPVEYLRISGRIFRRRDIKNDQQQVGNVEKVVRFLRLDKGSGLRLCRTGVQQSPPSAPIF
ncbi:MAG: hypothetical protein LC633_07200, partial [Desulfobulbaceae bacterium]|nr:hypothetical protein [Desulfobulbaceae bacterium]